MVACNGVVAHNGAGCRWHTGVQVVKGGGGMERVVVAGWRGWWRRDREGGGSGMERVVVGAWRGWADGVGVSVGGQHVGCEIHTDMRIGSESVGA